MKYKCLLFLRFAVIAGALAAAIYVLILVRAAQLYDRDTAVSVAAAVRLQPHNALYLDRLANWQPDDRENILRRSVEEDPFDYEAWIRLGLLAEMQDGDNVAAEKDYRQAERVNHMFLPRWTLANFYFRQQKSDEFFHWSKETLLITPYSSDPVFAQMWSMSRDENTLNNAIPDRPRILLQYAWYLSNSKHFDSIPRAVDRLIQTVGKDDPDKWGRQDLLAVSEDHMLAAGDLKPALKVWAELHEAGWLHQPVPNDQHPLTNGDFREPFYRHGFDWVTVQNPGTRVEQFPETPGVRVNLYGDEAEKATLLQQYVTVAAGRQYEMTWQAQANDLTDPSGLQWHLHPVKAAGAEIVSGDLLENNPHWSFAAPPEGSVFLLTLEYVRPLGSTRARGAVVLKSVALSQK